MKSKPGSVFRKRCGAVAVVLIVAGARSTIADAAPAYPLVPDLSCTQHARCVENGVGTGAFANPVQFNPGATLELEVTVANTGDVDLDVTLEDRYPCDGASVLHVVERITACEVVAPVPVGIIPGAFPSEQDFCETLIDALAHDGPWPLPLGRLRAAARETVRAGQGESFTFRFQMGSGPDDLCASVSGDPSDCVNTVIVVGEAAVNDPPVDPAETVCDATLDFVCHRPRFDKSVSVVAGGVEVDPLRVPTEEGDFPVNITYEFVAANDGDIPARMTIVDDFLCADIQGLIASGASLRFVDCPICPLGVGGDVVPGAEFHSSCAIRVDDREAAMLLGQKDSSHAPCEDPRGRCYKNCAGGVATAGDPVCDTPAPYDDEAVVCFCTDSPILSEPACNESLWRDGNNVILLRYATPLGEPPEDIAIRKLLADGGYGPDLSSDFRIQVDPVDPTIVRVQEVGIVLENLAWYAVTACKFESHHPVIAGDCNSDGRVLASDVSCINAGIPCFDCPNDRRDIDGDGRVLAIDVSVANRHIPLFESPPKPSGHPCP